jgi:hypothetical protein
MAPPRLQSAASLLAATLWLAPAGLSAPQPADHDAPPPRKRAISADVAAALSASMPKYNPPKPVEKKPGDDVDMRDVDKPRNKIIRLPQYVVKEKKPPVFTEREISTDKGLSDIALRRYFSETGLALNRFTIPLFGISKEAYAKMLYAEDERLKNISDLNDSARDIGLVNPENAKEIRRATQDTYDRGYDYIYSPTKR